MVGQVLKAQRRDRAVVWAVILICAAAIGAAKGEDLTSSGWPTRGWSVSSPGAEGLDSGALADLVEWAKAERVDSLLVVRHGKVVLDAYYAPFKSGVRHNLYSATKSFVGTLTAIELRDYFLDSVDHPVLDFFQNKSVTLVDERKKAITVQHLLDMTSGIEWDRGGAGSQGSALKMYKS